MQLSSKARRNIEGWAFVFPVVMGTVLFNILPMVPTIWLSLTDWTGISPGSWVGVDNYARMLRDGYFHIALKNTLIFLGGTVGLMVAASLSLALLVNRTLKGIAIFRAIYFAPVVTSAIAIGMAWKWILNARFGLVNNLLALTDIVGPRWLGDPFWAMLSVILVSVWHTMGYFMVIFLAGLQGIPQNLYEAASIDGASRWQKFWRVTWPLLSPTTFFVVMLAIIGSFKAFDLIFILTGGGPGLATNVYVYRLYVEAFQFFNMGYASAMGWVLFIIIAAFTMFQWKISSRWVFYR